MPTICEFDGITVVMYTDDHPPPHVHVFYSGHQAKIDLVTGIVSRGTLPPAQLQSVQRWRKSRMWDLFKAWGQLRVGRVPKGISPPK